MELQKINIMRGPNHWSVYHNKLIVMKVNLREHDAFNSNFNFAKALETAIPSLKYSPMAYEDSNFISAVSNGIRLEKIILRIAIELQLLAHINCRYGHVYDGKEKGVYNIVFAYKYENSGRYAARAAIDITEALLQGKEVNITDNIKKLNKLLKEEMPGPSTQAILSEAERRNIPCTKLSHNSCYMLGYGAGQKRFRATICSTTNAIAVDLASDKWATRTLMYVNDIPVSEGVLIDEETELQKATELVGFPLVIKPLDGNHGRGITTGINSYEKAVKAFRHAQSVSDEIIIEKFAQGNDFRFLVINYKFVAAAKRTPPMITGDAVSSIAELIEKINSDPTRGDEHENFLTKVIIDENTLKIFAERNLTAESILPDGETLYLKDTANLSSGGSAEDVSDIAHAANIEMAERIARLLNLDICGIDLISNDISVPLYESGGVVLEVNAAPGFRMHLSPTTGYTRNVAKPVIDMLFGANETGRIPIVAITGTNGKTTTTRLIAHIARQTGLQVGYTVTDGIYLNDTCLNNGDCSGPASAKKILCDPLVEYAVLECARGGIIRSGLGFDHCKISIVTNVSEDHMGLNDIITLADMARVKEVVPRSTASDGYAILNADDKLVCAMQNNLRCNIALFGMNASAKEMEQHINNGGLAVSIEDEYFVIYHRGIKSKLMQVADVPLTLGGKSRVMAQNVMAAILASIASSFSTDHIKEALKSFIPSVQRTPGRMNFFHFEYYTVLVDYAHNTAGIEELKNYLQNENAERITGVISATGDRREEDIRMMGKYAAMMFDDIIINHQKDGRGRSNEQLTDLLMEGINKEDPHMQVNIITDELAAVEHAIDHIAPGTLLVVLAEDIRGVINLVQQKQAHEQQTKQELYN